MFYLINGIFACANYSRAETICGNMVFTFGLFYQSEVSSTQFSYNMYKKFINSKLPTWHKTSPNPQFCFIIIAHRSTNIQ